MARDLDQDESIDRWTLVGDEPDLVTGKRGATRLITDHEEGVLLLECFE